MSRGDKMGLVENAFIEANAENHDSFKWNCTWKLEKFKGRAQDGNLEPKPYETIDGKGNIAVTVGITALLNLLTAEAAPTAFSNANGYIAVGSNAAAPAIGNTTLGTELDRQPMDGVFPTVVDNVCTWKSVFSTGASDGAWEEWGIFNAAAAGTMLNHASPTLGSKLGGTWNLTVTITVT